jgi:phage recombination protein Bet
MTVADAALAVRAEQGELSIPEVSELTGFSAAEIALVQSTMQKEATLMDVAMLLYIAHRNGLDPVAGQIRWIIRDKKGIPQVGIDGQRLIAARTGQYAGSEDIVFRGGLEVPLGKDSYTGKDLGMRKVPESAEACVWRIVSGHKNAFRATVRWIEFYPGPGRAGFMWREKPYHMLGKCAEAQALRKGFPAEMTGIEFNAAEGEPQEPAPIRVQVTDIDAKHRQVFGDWDEPEQIEPINQRTASGEGDSRPYAPEASQEAQQLPPSLDQVLAASDTERDAEVDDETPDVTDDVTDEAAAAWDEVEAYCSTVWHEIEKGMHTLDTATKVAPVDKVRVVGNAIGAAVGGDVDDGRLVLGTLTRGRAQLLKHLNVAEAWAIINHTTDTNPSFADMCKQIVAWRREITTSN